MKYVLFLFMIAQTSVCLAFEPKIVKHFQIANEEKPKGSLREIIDRTDDQYIQAYEKLCLHFHVSDYVKANAAQLNIEAEAFQQTKEYTNFVNRVNLMAADARQKLRNYELSLVLAYLSDDMIGGTYYSFEEDGIIRMQISCLNRDVGLSQLNFWTQMVHYLANKENFPDYNRLIVVVRNTSSEIPMLSNNLNFTANYDYRAPGRDPKNFTAYELKF